jgi:hypothetical protein
MSSSGSREDLSIDPANNDSMRRNFSENDISLSKPNISPWDSDEMPVRRRGVAPQDSHVESIDRRSGLNRSGAKQVSISGLRDSDLGNKILANGAEHEAEIRARLCTIPVPGSRNHVCFPKSLCFVLDMNVLPHHDDGYSSTDSPFQSPTSSPAPGADSDHAWLMQLRARTPSPPPPGAFHVGTGSTGSLAAPSALRAPAPRRLSPEAPTHAVLGGSSEKKSGRRSRKNSRNVTFSPEAAAHQETEKTGSPPHSPKEDPAPAPIPVVIISDVSSTKPKQAPSSPRPRSRSAAVLVAGNFAVPSKDTMDQLTQSPSPTLKKKSVKRPIELFPAVPSESDASVVQVLNSHEPHTDSAEAPNHQEVTDIPNLVVDSNPEPTTATAAATAASASPLPSPSPQLAPAVETGCLSMENEKIETNPVSFALPIVEEIDVEPRSRTPPKARQRTQSSTKEGVAPSTMKKPIATMSEQPATVPRTYILPASVALIAVVVAILLAWILG